MHTHILKQFFFALFIGVISIPSLAQESTTKSEQSPQNSSIREEIFYGTWSVTDADNPDSPRYIIKFNKNHSMTVDAATPKNSEGEKGSWEYNTQNNELATWNKNRSANRNFTIKTDDKKIILTETATEKPDILILSPLPNK